MASAAILLAAVLVGTHAMSTPTSGRAQVSTVVVTLSRDDGENQSSTFQAYNALFGPLLRPGEQMQGDLVLVRSRALTSCPCRLASPPAMAHVLPRYRCSRRWVRTRAAWRGR